MYKTVGGTSTINRKGVKVLSKGEDRYPTSVKSNQKQKDKRQETNKRGP